MPYTGNPSQVKTDAVRLLVGDTDPQSPLLSDDELNYLVERWGPEVYRIAIAAAEALAGKCSQFVDQTVGRVSVSWSKRAEQFRQLASSLRRQLSSAPYAGGISLDEIQSDRLDPDRPKPLFEIGMDDACKSRNNR